MSLIEQPSNLTLYKKQEVQEEKDRVASAASRQRGELEKLQRGLEDTHRHALEAMREELEQARDQQEKRHKVGVIGGAL